MSDLHFHSKKNEKEEKDKSLPFYMRLYPPIESNEQSESTLDKAIRLELNDDDDDKKVDQDKNKENANENLLTKEFLEELIKTPNTIPKVKILDIVSKALQNSKLIEKMEDDNKNTKKLNKEDLSIACAKKFAFKKFKKGEIIFRIGDDGDKFYYVLHGKTNILKIREIPNIYMSIIEYINYCIFLLKEGENYLFQEVIRINYKILKVSSEEEIITLFRIWFKISLIGQVNS